ncbi:hypothetical protein BU16DRAFT_282256 [Lophium mytilinum]|uniref:Telomerase reverse transcriptase n=1 Tax=Lophium mytilinum TaxID=390894 RepID=A0A6A6R5S8_9PEZI|nr:hypothetical protein BU16DRAFT_282256 [Lophium mytilinum]
MFLDTGFNSLDTVLANVYQSFLEAAVRCAEYMRQLATSRKPNSRLLIKTIDHLVALAAVLLQRPSRRVTTTHQRRCAVGRRQVQWLCCTAFHAVFHKRQTQHRELLRWLDSSLAAVVPTSRAELQLLAAATAGRA